MIYVMLIAVTLFFLNEILFLIRHWWKDVSLKWEMRRRGQYLREGWSVEGSERFRARLCDARDSKRKDRRQPRSAEA